MPVGEWIPKTDYDALKKLYEDTVSEIARLKVERVKEAAHVSAVEEQLHSRISELEALVPKEGHADQLAKLRQEIAALQQQLDAAKSEADTTYHSLSSSTDTLSQSAKEEELAKPIPRSYAGRDNVYSAEGLSVLAPTLFLTSSVMIGLVYYRKHTYAPISQELN